MYKIIIRDLNGFRKEFDLNDKVSVIGRGEKVHIRLDSNKISRQHFRIIFKGLKIYIDDLNSANGVFLNDEKIEKPMPISENDIIQFGEFYAQLNNTNKIRKVFKIDNVVEVKMDIIKEKNIKPFYKLISKDKRYPGLVFDIQKGITTIGRTRKSNIIIPDATLSGKHLKLEFKGDRLYVEDLGSVNGTKLNNKKVRSKMLMHNKDKLTIGDVEFVLETNIKVEKKKSNKKLFIIIGAVLFLMIIAFALKPKKEIVIEKKITERDTLCKGLDDFDCDIKLKERKIHKLLGESSKYAKMSKWDAAIEICDKILSEDPRNKNAQKYKEKYVNEKKNKELYDVAFQDKETDLEKALIEFRKIPKESNYHEGALLQVTQIKDQLVKTYFAKAKSLGKAKRFKEAYESLRALFKINSFHEKANKLKRLLETKYFNRCNKKNICRSSKYIGIGTIHKFVVDIKKQKNSKKVNYEEKLHQMYPNKILYNAIEAYYKNGELIWPIKYLSKVSRTNRSYEEAQVLLKKLEKMKYIYSVGLKYHSSKIIDRARNEWETFLKLDEELLPEGLISSYRRKITTALSESFFDTGNKKFKALEMKAAFKYLKEALHFNPNNMEALGLVSRLHRGAEERWVKSLEYEKQGDKKAFELWELIINITYKDTEVHKKALKKISEN